MIVRLAFLCLLLPMVACGATQRRPAANDDLVSDLGYDLPVRATGPVIAIDGQEIDPTVFHRFLRERLFFEPQFHRKTLNQIVEAFIEEQVLIRHAADYVDEVSDEAVEDALIKTLGGYDRRQALTKIGQTEDEYRETLRRRLSIDHKLNSEIELDDEALETYFDENRGAFEYAPGYRVRLLTLRLPLNRQKRAEVERLSADLFNLMTVEEPDYDVIARKADGLGFGGRSVAHVRVILRPFLDPRVIDQIEKMNPGETSHPIKTKKAIRIVHLIDFVPVKVRLFEDVKEEIRQRIITDGLVTKRAELLGTLLETQSIETHSDRLVRNLSLGGKKQPRNQPTSR